MREYVKIPVSVTKKTYKEIDRYKTETRGNIPIEEFLSGVIRKIFAEEKLPKKRKKK